MVSDESSSQMKIVHGDAGYILEDVPHLSDYIPNLPTYPNPLRSNPAYSVVKFLFTRMAQEVFTFDVEDLDKRKKVYKNTGVDFQEGRRRRQDDAIQIRKNRRQLSLFKKRKEDDDDTSSSSPSPSLSPYPTNPDYFEVEPKFVEEFFEDLRETWPLINSDGNSYRVTFNMSNSQPRITDG